MRCGIVFIAMALLAWPSAATAEHANINMRVLRLDAETGKVHDETSASADEEPPLGGSNPRPVLKVSVNEPLAFQFILTNTYPHGELKNVTVRYFVVRTDKIGQKIVPDLAKGSVAHGRFELNLKPKGKVGARVAFTLKERGVYLLRVQTANTKSDHEHFSAIDLQAE